MYETLAVWDTIPVNGPSAGMNRFANIWNAANEIVYSSTLTEVSTVNTTIKSKFDSVAAHKLIAESEKDFDIGGPHPAAEAIRAGILDELHQLIVPKTIGGGNYWLPKHVQAELELEDVRKFKNGTVHLRYKRI